MAQPIIIPGKNSPAGTHTPYVVNVNSSHTHINTNIGNALISNKSPGANNVLITPPSELKNKLAIGEYTSSLVFPSILEAQSHHLFSYMCFANSISLYSGFFSASLSTILHYPKAIVQSAITPIVAIAKNIVSIILNKFV